MRTALRAFLTLVVLAGCGKPLDSQHDLPDVMELSNTQRALQTVAAVKDDTEFRVYRRRPENDYWDHGTPYPRTNALAILKAISSAKPWDNSSNAAAHGQFHPHPPALKIGLAWWVTQTEKITKTNAISLCYGNWLFHYGGWIFQTSEEGHETLNKYFPENHGN
jgi:hypothetical protein